MEGISEEISPAFQQREKVIVGRGPQLPDVVKMLQTIPSSLSASICIDAMDECVGVHRIKLLNSLQKNLGKVTRHGYSSLEDLLSGLRSKRALPDE